MKRDERKAQEEEIQRLEELLERAPSAAPDMSVDDVLLFLNAWADWREEALAEPWANLCRRDRVEPEEIREYMRKLRDSGVTNMWGAGEYLQAMWPEIEGDTARAIVAGWFRNGLQRRD